MKTTRSSPSSINQQMLSCVWHGVCKAFTVMPEPILNVSPCFGVFVTASQSFPPRTGRSLNWDSWLHVSLGGGGPGRTIVPSSCCLQHDPNGFATPNKHDPWLTAKIGALTDVYSLWPSDLIFHHQSAPSVPAQPCSSNVSFICMSPCAVKRTQVDSQDR